MKNVCLELYVYRYLLVTAIAGPLEKNYFNPVIRTRSIRIYPKDPFVGLVDSSFPFVPCLRLELYGCFAPSK